jgi:hypothetical protein
MQLPKFEPTPDKLPWEGRKEGETGGAPPTVAEIKEVCGPPIIVVVPVYQCASCSSLCRALDLVESNGAPLRRSSRS